jgi:hypothetical protein
MTKYAISILFLTMIFDFWCLVYIMILVIVRLFRIAYDLGYCEHKQELVRWWRETKSIRANRLVIECLKSWKFRIFWHSSIAFRIERDIVGFHWHFCTPIAIKIDKTNKKWRKYGVSKWLEGVSDEYVKNILWFGTLNPWTLLRCL